jgi:hypothetical protein
MDISEQFEDQRYVKISNLLDRTTCLDLADGFIEFLSQGNAVVDTQCSKSVSAYAYTEFEKLLVKLLPEFEKVSGKRLIPTYSYARLYATDEELKNHTDRPSCEISATITLGCGGKPWPIFMGNSDKTVSSEIQMDVGDAVLYKGEQIHHWREKFEGDWQVQVFLHYVDADGANKEWAYDKRQGLNIDKQEPEPQQEIYCYYEDVLNSDACQKIINAYTQQNIKTEEPYIWGNVVNREIRNVERVPLSTYKDIGGRLASVGLSANFNRWKFDITHSSQAEFLIYNSGGRYTTHTDTMLYPGRECRKLTVLAFLNDDFEGGRFYLTMGHEKMYPPQKAGNIIVFPSFIPHGVEDIISGVRYSVVCWMDGPWFK